MVPPNPMVHRSQTLLLIPLALGLAGCGSTLEYPPPAQKVMPTGPEPLLGPNIARMSDLSVDAAVVKDVLKADPGSAWRWTNQHPRLKAWFHPGDPQNFYLRFTLAGVILKKIGPLTIRMIVNDHAFDARRFDKEQEYEYSKLVPAALLGPEDSAIVGFDRSDLCVAGRWREARGVARRDRVAAGGRTMKPVFYILLATALTWSVSYALGAMFLRALRLKMYRSEERFFGVSSRAVDASARSCSC